MNSKYVFNATYLLLIICFIKEVAAQQHRKQPANIRSENIKTRDTLILTQVFFRHGDRSPLFNFPKNHVNITDRFPMGFGQLTMKGKKQMLQLGEFLRKRYRNLLSENFHPHDAYIVSSDYDRTIVSAQSLLAGFFIAREKWNHACNWDPVPIRTIPYDLDNLLAFSAHCPKYHSHLDCYRFHGKGREVDKNYTQFYKFIAKNTGISLNKINFEKVSEIFDTLYVQDVHGLGLPDWCKRPQREPNLMRRISEYAFSALTYDKNTMTLRGGPLLREIMKNINAHYEQNTRRCDPSLAKYKVRLYAGHDSTVATLLQALGIYNRQIVPYAGAVMVELYKRSFEVIHTSRYTSPCSHVEDFSYLDTEEIKSMYYIKVLYRNCTNANFAFELPLPDCQDVLDFPDRDRSTYFLPGCRVETFKRLKASLLKIDWTGGCKLGRPCHSCHKFKKDGHDYSQHSQPGVLHTVKSWCFGEHEEEEEN